MSAHGYFKRKPELVCAVKHEGVFAETVARLQRYGAMRLGGFVGHAQGKMEVEALNGSKIVNPGEWIVIGGGEIRVMPNPDFHAAYMPNA